VDNETITSFRSDSILPEGTVHTITNEEVRPIAYHNIYPLPQTGVMIIPTTSTNNGVSYSLLSNKVTPAQNIQAIPSYIDNFLYGYADAVPMSQTSPSTPTTSPPIPTSPEGENNEKSTPTSTSTPNSIQEFPDALVLIIVIASAATITTVLKFKRKISTGSYNQAEDKEHPKLSRQIQDCLF
jgi:hypothetical protein